MKNGLIKVNENKISRAMKVKILLGCAIAIVTILIILSIIIVPELITPKGANIQTFRSCEEIFARIDYEYYKANKSERLCDILIELGLYKDENGKVKESMSDDELQTLCEEYTPDRFFSIMKCIEHAMQYDKEDYMPQNFVERYIKAMALDIYSAESIYKLDSGDWYDTHPGANPQPSSELVHGSRNVGPNNKVVYESREMTTTVDYYGDYAVSHLDGYWFNEGMYEWRNGTFYDVPSSWTKIYETGIWYKGEKIAVDNYIESNRFFVYNNIIYIMETNQTDSGEYLSLRTVDAK